MPIYMEIDGIKGNVTADGHADWIECSSMQWGVGRGISSTTGNVADREADAPNISEVSVTKMMDKASPLIFSEACIGSGKTVKVHMCTTQKQKLETYMEYTLEDTMISGYSVSSGGDRPSESITLSFTKLEMKYIPYKDDGSKGSPIPAGYDMGTGKKV